MIGKKNAVVLEAATDTPEYKRLLEVHKEQSKRATERYNKAKKDALNAFLVETMQLSKALSAEAKKRKLVFRDVVTGELMELTNDHHLQD